MEDSPPAEEKAAPKQSQSGDPDADAEAVAAVKPKARPPAARFEGAVRIGFAVPSGALAGSATTPATLNEGDFFSNQVPFWFDAGYRFPNVYVGAFLQVGALSMAQNATTGCGQNGVSCGGFTVAFGVDALLYLSPEATFDPWLGIGIGYEWVTFSQSFTQAGMSADGSASFQGPQFLNLQIGGDIRASEALSFGPFVSLSLGEYQKASVMAGMLSTSGDIQSQMLHQWVTLGVRGTYDGAK